MTADLTLWRLRCQNGSNDHDAYVERGPGGLPRRTGQETALLPLEDAERLKQDADRTLGGTLYLEREETTFRTCTPY